MRSVNRRPHVLLSCAMSIDGYIDDSTGTRLLLSNAADFDRVDAVRAEQDAILVGADTIRRDNPRLLVRSDQRRRQRMQAGRSASPIKVTLTRTGNLNPDARFFAAGEVSKLVYAASRITAGLARALGGVATVIDAGESPTLERILADLADRGVQRLMVEGGGRMHSQFLAAGLADELHLAVAPFPVGDSKAPRFLEEASYPFTSNRRMRLIGVEPIEDVALLRYRLSSNE
jgi:5-amino-6-(5-phosphoribosylamino)uracil reductase